MNDSQYIALVQSIIAQVTVAMEQRYISRAEVESKIGAAVPPQIRSMGSASMTNIGRYLKLEGSDSLTAVWGKIEPEGLGGFTLDYCIVGNQKVTIPTPTTGFLQILFGSSPSASWVAAMPVTQPSNGVVIEVACNRLYFTGEFGNG